MGNVKQGGGKWDAGEINVIANSLYICFFVVGQVVLLPDHAPNALACPSSPIGLEHTLWLKFS